VQEAVASLEKTLGHKVVPQVQWALLWNEQKDRFPDKATFVPAISRITIAWYERLQWRLDSDNFPQWTEELLELMSQKGGTKQLQIEPSPPPHIRPKTSWRAKTSSFYLGIPKTDPAPHAKVVAAFDQDFENLFVEAVGTAAPAEEGWDDLTAEPTLATTVPAVVPEPRKAVVTHCVNPVVFEEKKKDRLPVVADLSRPDQLFTQTTPYILSVDVSPGVFLVRSSHEPSLELLSAYLNKWGKLNIHDSNRGNVLNVQLIESPFFNGVMDAVSIEPAMLHNNRGVELNPTIVLAFIEGVLGYQLVYTNGRSWVYKSDTLLK